MFHKNVSNSIRSISTAENDVQRSSSPAPRLVLVPSGSIPSGSVSSGGDGSTRRSTSAFFELLVISAHRCSSFFAEAAVLVLVLVLLDRFMLKGRMEMGWVLSAFTISLMLLAASIATDFSARRWLKTH